MLKGWHQAWDIDCLDHPWAHQVSALLIAALGNKDRCSTIEILSQSPSALEEAAYMRMRDETLPLLCFVCFVVVFSFCVRGCLCVRFDARARAHGVWAPRRHKCEV